MSGRKDRAWHEMHTLIDIFFQAGCYDQLNMCMELVSRRLQQHTEACAHGADRPQLAPCETLLQQQLLSRPGAPRDAIVCESSQQGGGGAIEHSRARSKTQAAGASPGVVAEAAAALVGGRSGGAVGRGNDGKGNGKKGERGRGARPSP